MFLSRRKAFMVLLAVFLIVLWVKETTIQNKFEAPQEVTTEGTSEIKDQSPWSRVTQRYPVKSMIRMPSPVPKSIPTIQHRFAPESKEAREVRLARLEAVKGNFTHAWQGYKKHAWMRDEVRPLSGEANDLFGGWAATMVDALDSLWIMDLHDEFKEAVQAASNINFSRSSLDEVSIFETNIRYLGGFLAAYDLSGEDILLKKAIELGEMLYVAFDTPNRMPITRWDLASAARDEPQKIKDTVLVADLGSLTLEFTRLSQITQDPRYYDAIQRIMNVFEDQQDRTKIPGLWPVVVNVRTLDFTDYSGFTLGGMADSLYEYLPKQHIMLGGATKQYRKLYQKAMKAVKRYILFRPMTQEDNILFSGSIWVDGKTPLSELTANPQVQHLGCFTGGMVAVGAKIFNSPEDMEIARKLVNGCIWAYETGKQGIMPEIMHTVSCDDPTNCIWDEKKWHKAINKTSQYDLRPIERKIQEGNLPPGVTKIDDSRYILRPEAIESIFILYRITGDPSLPDKAWKMFNSIVEHTTTDIAHAALRDCTMSDPPKDDRMESFWLAETLKYFYLMFSEPGVISLDEYVLNTEAHPLKRVV